MFDIIFIDEISVEKFFSVVLDEESCNKILWTRYLACLSIRIRDISSNSFDLNKNQFRIRQKSTLREYKSN